MKKFIYFLTVMILLGYQLPAQDKLVGVGTNKLFAFNEDGTDLQTWIDLTTPVNPSASLIESGGKLWGMSSRGGVSNDGTIFSLNPDGTGLIKVHDFDDTNGREPEGSLTESNNKLWGMTFEGGDSDLGVIFTLDTDGTNFTKVHDFNQTNEPDRLVIW